MTFLGNEVTAWDVVRSCLVAGAVTALMITCSSRVKWRRRIHRLRNWLKRRQGIRIWKRETFKGMP